MSLYIFVFYHYIEFFETLFNFNLKSVIFGSYIKIIIQTYCYRGHFFMLDLKWQGQILANPFKMQNASHIAVDEK